MLLTSSWHWLIELVLILCLQEPGRAGSKPEQAFTSNVISACQLLFVGSLHQISPFNMYTSIYSDVRLTLGLATNHTIVFNVFVEVTIGAQS